MREHLAVNVFSNGDYWQADWKDVHGRRRKKSIGAKSELSRRQAMKIAQSLANRLNNAPAAFDTRSPQLASFADAYIASRTDLKPGTLYLHRLTRKYLIAFFGEQKRLDQVTRADARSWVTALAQGQLSEAKPMAPPTVRGHVINTKAIFKRAVEDDILLVNPFDRIIVTLPRTDKNWHYVSMEQFERLLLACKTTGWKRLIALCRLAGLRRGEAMNLCWSGVDLARHRLSVFAEKTGQRRTVPIVQRLREILSEDTGCERRARVCEVNPHCLWRNFTVIRKHAGLPPWDDAFQVMRRNCETDWAQQFPQYVVSEWLGHDITVSAEHYLAVPQELYLKAAGVEPNVVDIQSASPSSTSH